jgi:hypothetical protein
MKTKLIFETGNSYEYTVWSNLFFIPRINEYFNVQDLLKKDEIDQIIVSAQKWSGTKGTVKSVEYRHDDNDFYTEIIIWCEE